MTLSLGERDLASIWHPCSQMKDYESFPPIAIDSARGSELYCENGHILIDAISSWWCKSLGHAHPRLQKALVEQSKRIEHVIQANTTHETIVRCSEAILELSPHHGKVFYASDGSCAVEIALKMALHAQHLQGNTQKVNFLALKDGYHGETALTLSVSDQGYFKTPYQSLLKSVPFIDPMYFTNGMHDPSWHEPITDEQWLAIEKQIEPYANTTAAFILEPIVQGAGHMRIYRPDVLKRLREYTQEHGIYLIADEIMTGVGRTGELLACKHAGINADFVCLSKGLTSGFMPFSAVLITDSVYDLFYDDYETGKSFLHSHTFSGHALGAAVALETLSIVKEDNMCQQAQETGKLLYDGLTEIAKKTGKLGPVRQLGCLAAADLIGEADTPRAGYGIYKEAVKRGALLRPIGNTIVWIPPFNTSAEIIDRLQTITHDAIEAVTR